MIVQEGLVQRIGPALAGCRPLRRRFTYSHCLLGTTVVMEHVAVFSATSLPLAGQRVGSAARLAFALERSWLVGSAVPIWNAVVIESWLDAYLEPPENR